MILNFYTDEYIALLSLPFWETIYRIFFWYFGWLPIAIAFLYGVSLLWLDYVSDQWYAKQKFVYLAIDVPKANVQGPKAVENLFTYVMGTQQNVNLIEEWWEGKFQLGFSFEIIGIDGYIQFLVRAPIAFKPNIETAIYSQYPDAEITEVPDYTVGAPGSFPDAEYDIWGAEFVPVTSEFLPMKTYKQFEHMFGEPETQYKDPLVNLMDLMSSLRPGEQLWMQLLIRPIGNDWIKRADTFIADIIGKEPMALLNLPPGKRKQLEGAIEKKNKTCFAAKIRTVYFSKKEVMDKAKVVNGFVGFMRQFGENNLNGLMPHKTTMTSTAYFAAASRIAGRKTRMMSAFRGRSMGVGANPYVLGVEELATLWHFPLDAVTKAPLLQRASARKIEAPMGLPAIDTKAVSAAKVENIFDQNYEMPVENKEKSGGTKVESFADFLTEEIAKEEKEDKVVDMPPSNLPFV